MNKNDAINNAKNNSGHPTSSMKIGDVIIVN